MWAIRGRAAGQGIVFWPHCPKQGVQFCLASVLNKLWYHEPGDLNPDCEQSLSFPSLRERASDRAARCILSTELNRLLPGRYNVINQHQILFSGRECYSCRYVLI